MSQKRLTYDSSVLQQELGTRNRISVVINIGDKYGTAIRSEEACELSCDNIHWNSIPCPYFLRIGFDEPDAVHYHMRVFCWDRLPQGWKVSRQGRWQVRLTHDKKLELEVNLLW